MRAVRNFLISVSLIFEYLFIGGFFYYTIRDRRRWREKAIQKVSEQCRRLLRNIHFDVTCKYSRPDLFKNGKTYFMVCNHMSYMDILFLSSGVPAVFVTSVEMKDTPFLGQCAAFGGSYFVERRDRTKIPQEVKDLASLIQQGFHVFVFPEATSNHGMNILPFKRSMFSVAIEAGVDVLPICLRYEEIDGQAFDETTMNKMSWYGKMPFLSHFLKIMTMRSAKVSVEYLEPISTQIYKERNQLSDLAYQQITQAYFANRPASFKPWPLADKKNENSIQEKEK